MCRVALGLALAAGLCGCDFRYRAEKSSITVSTPAPNGNAAAPANTAVPPAAPEAAAQPAAVEVKILDHAQIQSLIASHQGKVVVVDIWSTSCGPCVAEFPNLVKLSQKYPAEDLACVSVALEFQGAKGEKPDEHIPGVHEFLKKQNAAFDNVLAREDSDTMHAKLEITAPPVVFVYDRAGKLAKRFDNDNAKSEAEAFTYAHVGQFVDELLKK